MEVLEEQRGNIGVSGANALAYTMADKAIRWLGSINLTASQEKIEDRMLFSDANVLIIEDEKELIDLLLCLFGKENWWAGSVKVITSASRLEEELKTRKVDIIVSDHHTEGNMTGDEALTSAIKNNLFGGCRMIVGASGSEGEVENAFRGAFAKIPADQGITCEFLKKPYSLAALKEIIERRFEIKPLKK